MKLKLHNTIEILTPDKTIVAHNTLLRGVYDKIKNLEEYTSRIAVGNGTEEIDFSGKKLSSYVSSFETITEDICADPSKETLFIKKLVSFDENDQTSFSFCELGLCSSSESNPDIYNHVLLKDDNGNVVTINKNAGDNLQIRITIYLELENLSEIGFYKGENALIKQFLGEDLGNIDHKIYVVRGEILAENNDNLFRPVPVVDEQTKTCSLVLSESSDGEISMEISAKLGAGEAEEIVFVYASEVVLRASLLSFAQPILQTETLSSSTDKVVEVGKNIKEIQALTLDGNSILENAKIQKYGTKITDKCEEVFDETFSSTDKRFVSPQGDYIVFIKNGTTFLYHFENNEFKRVNVSLPSNIMDIFVSNDKIVCVLNEQPYVQIYDKINNSFSLAQTSLGNFNLSSFSYSWKSAKIIMSNNKIIIGIIENNTNQTPFALTFSKNSNGIYVDEIIRLSFDHADFMLSIESSNYSENMILFFTSIYYGDDIYGIEKIDQNEHGFVASSEQAFAIMDENIKAISRGRIIISQKENSNPIKFLYSDNYDTWQTSIVANGNIWLSERGEYLIVKNDNKIKIYNCHKRKTLTEFEEGYLDLIDQDTAVDFEFAGDKIIVFTNNQTKPIYSVTIKKNMTRIDNISGQNISATLQKYNILGSGKDDGVKTSIILYFGENSQATNGE